MAQLTTIARPYAKAAYQYAESVNAVAAWATFLEKASVIVADPTLLTMLKNPAYSVDVKASVLIELLDDVSVSGASEFIKVLGYYRRFLALGEIFKEYQQLVARGARVMDITINSAFELSASELESLKDKLKVRYQGQEIRVAVAVDASLIGGFEIRSSDTVIDATVRGRLAKVAAALSA
jgi:F-type H+-transporting ATPase subunit delta